MLSAAWRRWQPYLLLTVLALPALWPLAGPGLARTNDALPHLYRAVELDALVSAGVFFPRWAPDLVHGFGYPVFNYFPYLAHYLVVLLHRAGLNFVSAYNAACALALLASGFFAYRLGRAHFGATPGLVAGVAYLYSPYLLYDTYIRGSLPESVALALLPLIMFYLRRAAGGDRQAIARAALALAAALLAHNGVMVQVMPFLVLYATVVWIDERRPPWGAEGRRTKDEGLARTPPQSHALVRRLMRGLTTPLPHLHTFTLAFLLSAFFTLPALGEARFVQIARGTGNGGMSYIDNFLTLGELFALPRLPVDPGLLNPPVVRSLPLAALVVAALGGLRWLYRRPPRAHSRALLFFALAALAAAFLIHPLSRPLWDTLPLLRLTLFPWRLLGPISLFVALLAGAAFIEAVPDRAATDAEPGAKEANAERHSSFVFRLSSFVLALSLLVIAGLPFATPPREAVPNALTLADVARFEVPPVFIGTTTVGEYLPVWVHTLPDTAPNRDQLLAGQPVERHSAPNATVRVDAHGPTGDSYSVAAPAATTFLYRAFYFPGWRAVLDGRPVPITVTYPDGLMTVAVPAGTHSLRFHFGSTPIRMLASALALLGLALTAIILLAPLSATARPEKGVATPSPAASPRFSLQATAFGLAILLASARPLLYDVGRTPLLQRGPRPTIALDYDYAGELTLLGLDAATAALPADEALRVDLYWQANHPLGIPYGFDVRLVDAAGHTWSQPDVVRPRDWRFTPGTDFWPADQYILDSYQLEPVPGTPPGIYHVRVNVFAWPTLQTIGSHRVYDVTVNAPSRARACALETDLDHAWEGARLTSAGFSTANGAPGDDVVFSACWQAIPASAGRAARPALAAELRLLDKLGQTVASQPFSPGGGAYPAEAWTPGDSVLDQIDVRLPAALESGTYTWAIAGNDSPAYALGALTVNAPERTFVAPPVANVLDASLGPLSLHGFSLPRGGQARGTDLALTLVWRAKALLPESYHVFVHLLAADGSLAAQSDGVPAGWTRRTTGWLPGEFVTDERSLFLRPDLPAGTYTLWAGMYAGASGQRLVTDEFGEGRVPLGEVVVE